MKYAIGGDHGGFELKEKIKEYLESKGHIAVDYGTFDETACNYPDIALKVGEAIKDGEQSLGILICGTGIGISMAANKIPSVRAAVCSDYFSAKYTRLHNDANIICFGARTIGAGVAQEMAEIFLNTPFEGERHKIRVDLITEIEKKYNK